MTAHAVTSCRFERLTVKAPRLCRGILTVRPNAHVARRALDHPHHLRSRCTRASVARRASLTPRRSAGRGTALLVDRHQRRPFVHRRAQSRRRRRVPLRPAAVDRGRAEPCHRGGRPPSPGVARSGSPARMDGASPGRARPRRPRDVLQRAAGRVAHRRTRPRHLHERGNPDLPARLTRRHRSNGGDHADRVSTLVLSVTALL